MRKRGYRGRTVQEHAWLGARAKSKDGTREHADRDTGRADSPVYVSQTGDARKLTRNVADGPVCIMLRNGQPTSARERRGEVVERGEQNVAPRYQTPGPKRETVRLTPEQRADAEVRAAEAAAMRRLRRYQLARAGLLGLGD